MIVVEFDATLLRRGERPFHELSGEEQRVVLTHWYKRHAGVVDGTTLEPVTAGDAVALLHATRGRKRTSRDEAEAGEATVRRLEALRDAAAERATGGTVGRTGTRG